MTVSDEDPEWEESDPVTSLDVVVRTDERGEAGQEADELRVSVSLDGQGDADPEELLGVTLAAVEDLSERVASNRTTLADHEDVIVDQHGTLRDQRGDIETLRERLEALQSEVARLRIERDRRE